MHTMTLIRWIGNIQDWQCNVPGCGRYILITLHPFHIEVIQAGDVTVGHSGMNVEGLIK